MNISELINYKDNHNRLNYICNNRENIVPFVGAGVSIDCILFSWLDMGDKLCFNQKAQVRKPRLPARTTHTDIWLRSDGDTLCDTPCQG